MTTSNIPMNAILENADPTSFRNSLGYTVK